MAKFTKMGGHTVVVTGVARRSLHLMATIPMPEPAYADVMTVLVASSSAAARSNRGRVYDVVRYPSGEVVVEDHYDRRRLRSCMLQLHLKDLARHNLGVQS